jgi:DNA-binding LacI/PurR family transcriptional regulator/GAF domain-containing protein
MDSFMNLTGDERKWRGVKSRPTIAFLAHTITDGYGSLLWEGVVDASRERNANLICFPGWALEDGRGFNKQANVIYRLVNSNIVDGLVISSGVLGNYVGLKGLKKFCAGFNPLPMASIAVEVDGIPSVLVDNRLGLQAVMAHLIEAHGLTRFAFISGPEGNVEAQARYEGFLDGLEKHKLHVNPLMISPPTNWDDVSGMEAARFLLDEKKLKPGVDFQAIVTGSDNVAYGAMVELQSRGIHIPGEVAVTGFDDEERSAHLPIPLTTVRQSLYEQAHKATEMVLNQLDGIKTRSLIKLPTELVKRQSCGCMVSDISQIYTTRSRIQTDYSQDSQTKYGQAFQGLEYKKQSQALRDLEDMLTLTIDVNSIMDRLVETLRKLKIPSCYISLYEHRSPLLKTPEQTPIRLSKLVLAYEKFKHINLNENNEVISSQNFIPESWLNNDKCFNCIVEPLYFLEEQLGIALFEISPYDGVVYETIRGQISSAIKRALLVEEAQKGKKYLQSLYQASGRIISIRDPQKVLSAVAESICETMVADGADIAIVQNGQLRRLARGNLKNDVVTKMLESSLPVAQEVIKNNSPLFFDNLKAEYKDKIPELVDVGIIAAACFPFCLREKPIGVLWVYYREPHVFLETEVNALYLYINQAAIAYMNSRHMSELEHLRQAAENIARPAEVHEVLQQIANSACEVLEADSTVIWSYYAAQEVFIPAELVGARIDSKTLEAFKDDAPQPGGTASFVIEKKYLAITDVDNPDYYFLNQPAKGRGLRGALAVKSFQGILLHADEEPLGVLYVNYKEQKSLDEEERTTLEAFAFHAALALKKARLLEQVSRAHETAKLIAKVSVSEDFNSILNAVASGIKDTLACDAVVVFIYDQETSKLMHPPFMVGVFFPEQASEAKEVLRDSIVYKMLYRNDPYIVDTISKDPLFKERRFAYKEGIESCVAIPLHVVDQRVGVMFLNFRTKHHFTSEEISDIEFFAHQASVAIRDTLLINAVTKKAAYLETLYEAGKVITSTFVLDKIILLLVEKASLLTSKTGGKQARFCYAVLKEGAKLKFMAAYPSSFTKQLKEKVSVVDLEHDERIGIVGRAAKMGESYLVPDVTIDSDYIKGDEKTSSELAVPIKIGNEVIGVVDVEHSDFEAFNNDDKRALESLATITAISIQNSRQYEELIKTKGLVGAQTAQTWMGMASSAWRHTVDKSALTIRETAELLRRDGERNFWLSQDPKAHERISMIEELANQILNKPITPPLSSESDLKWVPITLLVSERAKQLWRNPPYVNTSLQLSLRLSEDITCLANPEWLLRAFDMIVDNAVKAVANCELRKITIGTRASNDRAEIFVSDTGRGISNYEQKEIDIDIIKPPYEVGKLGRSLSIAQTIIQSYGGDIKVESTGTKGTTIAIWLPLGKEK